MKIIFFNILVIVMVLSSATKGVYFHDFPDDGTREVATSIEAYYEHALKSMDYVVHGSTPGYIRVAVSNQRLYNHPDGKHRVSGEHNHKWIEGAPVETGDPLHFAINGGNRAFFTVLLDNDLVGYTRDGRFRISFNNTLVTLSGNYPVLGRNGIITLPRQGQYTISRNGGFFVDSEFIDTIKVTVFEYFEDMNRHLDAISPTFFILNESINTLDEDKHYSLLQGFITQANSFKSYDSTFYRLYHEASVNSLDKMIEYRRKVFNSME